MILLRAGRLEDAEGVFATDLARIPWPDVRDYFRSGLALVRLRRNAYKTAAEALVDVVTPLLVAPANVLRLHAFGADGETERASQLYSLLREDPRPMVVEVSEELHRRLVAHEQPLHTDEWLMEREEAFFLPAA